MAFSTIVTLLLMILTTHALGAIGTILIKGPQFAEEHDNVELYCIVDSENVSGVYWKWQKHQMDVNSHGKIQNKTSLIIEKVRPRHAGLYECCLEQAKCAELELTILSFENVRSIGSPTNRSSLTLLSEGLLRLKVRHNLENTSVILMKEPNEVYHASRNDSNYIISTTPNHTTYQFWKMDTFDSGSYVINVGANTTSKIFRFSIFIRGKPTLNMEDVETLWNADRINVSFTGVSYPPAIIECEIIPCVEQFQSSECVDDRNNLQRLTVDNLQTNETVVVNGSMQISGPFFLRATIFCKAYNEEGNTTFKSNLYPQSIDDQMKIDIIFPKDDLVPGDTIAVQCTIERYNLHNFEIIFSNGEYEYSVGGIARDNMLLANIEIFNVSDSNVTCRTMLKNGSYVEASLTLHLREASLKFKTGNITQERELSLGHYSTLHCDAVGRPAPTIYWFKNDRFMGKNAEIYNVSLLPDENGSKIECIAKSRLGRISRTWIIKALQRTHGGVIRIEGPRIARKGSTIEMKCVISALDDKNASVSWYFTGTKNTPSEIKTNGDTDYVVHKNTLIIPRVSLSHVKQYKCCWMANNCAKMLLIVVEISPEQHFESISLNNSDIFILEVYHRLYWDVDVRLTKEEIGFSKQKNDCSLCKTKFERAKGTIKVVKHGFYTTILTTVLKSRVADEDSGWYTLSVSYNETTEFYRFSLLVTNKTSMVKDVFALRDEGSVEVICYSSRTAKNMSMTFTPSANVYEEDIKEDICRQRREPIELWQTKVNKTFPPYLESATYRLPKIIPGILTCKALNQREVNASLYVQNFREPIMLEILTPAANIVSSGSIVVRCQVNIYNFISKIILQHGNATYNITGWRYKYAWVVNYTLPNVTEDSISCTATGKTGGKHLKRTIHLKVNRPMEKSSDPKSLTVLWYIAVAGGSCVITVVFVLLIQSKTRKPVIVIEEIDEADQSPIMPSEYEFSLGKLTFGEVLGEGAFGIVRKAVARDIYVHEPSTTVAVKMLKPHSSDCVVDDFVSELTTMVSIGQHLNIVNLLGAVTDKLLRRNIIIIFEYCQYGSLDVFLATNRTRFVDCLSALKDVDNWRTSKQEGEPQQTPVGEIQFNTASLICWAAQVATGMTYLSSKQILHGDLAARNVLLCDKNVVKITDFGLSRSLYRGIYEKKSETPLPIKWIAVECFKELTFSTKTDVWSFGVFLWELFSFAATPYPGVTNGTEMYDLLDTGYRMPKPSSCSQEMYGIMIRCWYVCARLRPDFCELAYVINEMLPEELKNYYIALNGPYVKKNALSRVPSNEQESIVPNVSSDAIVTCPIEHCEILV